MRAGLQGCVLAPHCSRCLSARPRRLGGRNRHASRVLGWKLDQKEHSMLKFLGGAVGIIFIIGLLVVIGLLALIF